MLRIYHQDSIDNFYELKLIVVAMEIDYDVSELFCLR